MPLQKEIEFPLFYRGLEYDSEGKPVIFTDDDLRMAEKNGNFVIQSGILYPPVKYDHPAFGAPDKDNHGRTVRYTYRDGALYQTVTNWSDRIVADKKREAKIAYSGEMRTTPFSYFDPISKSRKTLKGPVPVGLAILGDVRPAIKNLKPFTSFEFSESVSPADAWETRESLRKSGLVAEDCSATQHDSETTVHFFGEVENDASRFFEEQKEQTMTDAEIQALVASTTKAAVEAATAPLNAKIKEQDDKISSFSETSARAADVKTFCESVQADKPRLTKLGLGHLSTILNHPAVAKAADLDKEIRAFVEGLSPIVLPGARKEGDDTDKGGGADDEPEPLAKARPKHFSDITANQDIVDGAIAAFGEYKPDAFKGIENNPAAQLQKVRSYVISRDTAN